MPYFDKPKIQIGPAFLESALMGKFNKVKIIFLISSCSKWGYGRNGVFILLRLPDRSTHTYRTGGLKQHVDYIN